MIHDQPDDQNLEHLLKLSGNDIRAARRLLQLLARAEDETSRDAQLLPMTRPCDDSSRLALVARAREEFGNRRRRIELFARSMFGEAAWDMLLALYILDMSGQRQTVGSLLQFSGTPMSTAKRWLDFLEARGLVTREEHPTDRRTAFVSLSATAREKMDLYYSETSSSGI